MVEYLYFYFAVVVYGDHSLHVWDFHEENEVIAIRLYSLFYLFEEESLICTCFNMTQISYNLNSSP